ncbi:MAG: hypothetical protein A3H79_02935 [Candidatus Levybacteria bacterium RIFCSPLOWO2_02_FULL_36_8b]|nr:MAG: hypothetical protein A3H79_02935 [Candidatus Levybacteria bacterium RIFCSPLOWO2_02_FULL_36_8b]
MNTISNKKVVCLGGGIGTVNLISGLKEYTENIFVVISMADEGGSSGRLRRLYKIFPPGDMVSCMSALVKSKNPVISQLLTYRFPGNRYGKDDELGGQKLGNLVMAAMINVLKDSNSAIELFKKTFDIPGVFMPATSKKVSISVKTADGNIIFGEEKIDLGKYNGKRVLERVYLHPKSAKAANGVIECLEDADVIIAGPGDLYTTILPVLIVPGIAKVLKKSKALRIFIVNIANKPFETKGYDVYDYIKAIKKHLGVFPFDKIVINNNYSISIPKKYHYKHVLLDSKGKSEDVNGIKMIKRDLIDENFPIYHSSSKLAKVVAENI